MVLTQNPGKIALWALGVTLLLLAFLMPAYQWPDRYLFLEDSFWTISWAIIAWTSFRDKRAGFPPAVITLTLGVELYLCFHYTVVDFWSYHPWLLINYILWPLLSLVNMIAIFRYSRDEFISGGSRNLFIIRLILETGIYFLLFRFLAGKFPKHEIMLYFGQSVIAMISLQFVFMILVRNNLEGQSLTGNVFRLLGGVACYILNSTFRNPDMYLSIIMPVIVLLDASYLVIYFKRWHRRNV